ncbi:TetR/AcrR family transcriptional regulator [Streptomyces sp. NPDC055400]
MKQARQSKAAMDSEATGQMLERAALQLLDRDGVLNGLNLREVADVAGVNRGLVYHYFGSRHDLLRAALRRTAETRREQLLIEEKPSRFSERMLRSWRGCLHHASAFRLVFLLLLDRDPQLKLMPLRETTQERLQSDIDQGYVAADADPVALHTFLKSVNYGYVLTRKQMAKEFGIGVRDLDQRFGTLLEQLCAGVDGPGPNKEAEADGPVPSVRHHGNDRQSSGATDQSEPPNLTP